jgi:long-chain acyl-CoA synthetase
MTDISSSADPKADAVVMASSGERLSFAELETRSRRLAHLLRDRGLECGAHMAVLLDNNLRYFEVCWAARRAGLFITPVNWHLGPGEAGYIVEDCGATALVTSNHLESLARELGQRLGSVTTRLVVDDAVEGFEDYEAAIASQPHTPLEEETAGALMFYSSGTTGRPKGILPNIEPAPFGTPTGLDMLTQALYGFEPGMVYLCPAPLYHAAPIAWSLATQRAGGTVVVMERFDAEGVLAAIEEHRVTHVQFVPTHFIRMLRLDPEIRERYDLSSLRTVIHAAAPCPVEIKRQMLDWFGPIIYEYYAGSEGSGFCAVGPEEWLAHPGTVGRPLGVTLHITDEDGTEQPTGEVGQIWFESGVRFQYHHDEEKTKAAFNEHGWSTLGDVGYLDAEGYLYLTDRISHMIISGGVNIYPQEIEDVVVMHLGVADVAVIGAPDEEMGESVMAVVQPTDPDADEDALAAELNALCRAQLAGFKCPRQYRFTASLPRLPTGKLLKRVVREEFGGSSAGSVVGT